MAKKIQNPVATVAIVLAICAVCGVLLALCHDLFYVPDEVKFQNSVGSVYKDFQADPTFDGAIDENYRTNEKYGEVLSVMKATDGGYIIEALGVGGYHGGTVTLYVAIKSITDGEQTKFAVVGWSIKESVGQSFIGKITEDKQKSWYINADISQELYGTYSVASGATFSSAAVNNAINMAAYYARNVLTDVEGGAQ